MSGYFSGLMRSSGLRVGAAGAAPQMTAADAAGLIEVDEIREVASASTTPPPAAVAAAARIATSEPTVQANAPLPTVQVAATDSAQPSAPVDSVRLDVEDVRPRTAAPRHAAIDPAIPAAPAQPDPVRLAMQWIARDPAITPAAQSPAPPMTDAHALDRAMPPIAPVRRPSRGERERVVDVLETVVTANEGAAQRAPAVETPSRTIGVRDADTRETPAVDRRAPVDRARPAAIEDAIEISIGAINLHVEAPAPQTVVQPPPQPPRRASSPRPERSGLGRRYLRSF